MQSLSEHSVDTRQVEVALPVFFGARFDYVVPEPMHAPIGSFVSVPFGNKMLVGVVWGRGTQPIAPHKLKPLAIVHTDIPPLSEAMRRFIDRVADYYMAPRGSVIKMMLSVPEAISSPPIQTILHIAQSLPGSPEMLTAARQRVISHLQQHDATSGSQLAERTGVSTSVISSLIDQGWITRNQRTHAISPPIIKPQKPSLNPAQQEAANCLIAACAEPTSHRVHVIDGVTGSGKTEVYFEAIEACIKSGKQVLILLPEIALSVQWAQRFEARFGFAADLWHSSISNAQKKGIWRSVACGSTPVLVGARSALCLPFSRLGLIVVDEEHEASYKQEDGVMYHARDMAIARGHDEQIPVVLASATPSLETQANITSGRFHRVHLPARFGDAELPSVRAIDMRQQRLPAGRWISNPLHQALQLTLEKQQQAVFFLNRRGYAPLVLCRHCGHRFACPHCSSWLVLHQSNKQLQCHHCGHTEAAPQLCPSCQETDMLVPCGPGVERLEEEASSCFPNARIHVLTSDHLSSKSALEREIARIQNREIDILIGTQLLAKGHHFPSLTLVGIVDADLGLQGGDPRTMERTWQVLHQLSGRAGRETERGRVLLQTWQPEHPVMKALIERDERALMELETHARKEANLPPFGRLAAIIIESTRELSAQQAAQLLARTAPHLHDVTILGPAPAPLYRLRNYYRWRFLIKCPRNINIQRIIQSWIHHITIPSAVKIKIDIDPYSFL